MDIKLRCSLILSLLWIVSLYGFTDTEKERDTLALHTANPVLEESTAQFFQFPELDAKFPVQKKINISSAPEFSF
ncbi:hypothetical protein, partial [Aquimarina algiphila]|uniref:hypothetical protein n=1 Tax=Aquimarina algiphila TaxID=2047982 RepID=UPI00232DA84A